MNKDENQSELKTDIFKPIKGLLDINQFTFEDRIFLKNLVTNEGIFENIYIEGTFDEFINNVNDGKIIKMFLPESEKFIYFNSIYIISFEY